MNISNSILSSGGSGGECSGPIIDGGYNLAKDATCGLSAAGSQQSVSDAQLGLGLRGSNGGATQTVPLLSGSVALNAIPIGTNGCGVSMNVDQRHVVRPRGGACEIGAYEADPVVVGDGSAPSCSFGALQNALNNFDSITFNCPANTSIVFPSTITPTRSVTVDGTGQSITLSGGGSVNHFLINPEVSLSLAGLTIANGVSATTGGAITNLGTLIISSSTFSGNSAATKGGAIFEAGYKAIITNSTFSANSSSGGGAIATNERSVMLTIANSTFVGNSVGLPFPGGAILIGGSSTFITNSTFSGNSAFDGGAIYQSIGTSLVTNSTFLGNSASSDAGAIYLNRDGINLIGTILSSTSGGECLASNGASLNNGGYNLTKDASCDFIDNGSLQNVTIEQLALGALGTNGGPTQTMLPGNSSIALDRIPAASYGCGTTVTTDQRGIARPQHGNCDVGAVEVPYRVPPRLVSE